MKTPPCADDRWRAVATHDLLPDTECCVGLLGRWRPMTGQAGEAHEALRLSRELLRDETRVLGADRPEALTTRNNIASLTGLTGEAHEALRLLQEVLPDQVRVLGADHPHTLTSRNTIAYWTWATGRWHEALRLARELLRDETRVLGLPSARLVAFAAIDSTTPRFLKHRI